MQTNCIKSINFLNCEFIFQAFEVYKTVLSVRYEVDLTTVIENKTSMIDAITNIEVSFN